MKYTLSAHSQWSTIATDCLIVPMYEKDDNAEVIALDKAMNGQISQLIAQGDFIGKHSALFTIALSTGIAAKRVILLGLGERDALTHGRYRTAVFTAIKQANQSGVESASFIVPNTDLNLVQSLNSSVEMAGHALYEFKEGKSTPKNLSKDANKTKPNGLKTLSFVVNPKNEKNAKAVLTQASALVSGMNLTKDLGNRAPNFLNPTTLAKEAQALAKSYKDVMTCDVLDEEKMKSLGMGSLLAVSQGSIEPAKLIVLEYKNAKTKGNPIVLVGKGVTFDSGGISLKPGDAMDEMKYDMCGAASVLGAFKAIAKMDLKINAVAIIPSVENMPSGSAARPGDVVTSMSGQTIEILNTDAEGRLILCDALTYAEKFEPKAVVDIATLTGAIIVALGNIPSGLFANDQTLADRLKECADKTDDKVWQLPIWEEYQPLLDSNFADIANIGSRAGGSITAACFLARFTKKYPWAHLDIAGTAWKSGKDKGASGRPVSLLVEFLKSYSA